MQKAERELVVEKRMLLQFVVKGLLEGKRGMEKGWSFLLYAGLHVKM